MSATSDTARTGGSFDEEDVDYFREDTTASDFSSGDTPSEERDEVKEVQKMARKETARVVFWRVAVTVVLLLTAVAVTLTTYRFLINEEEEDFETAVSLLLRRIRSKTPFTLIPSLLWFLLSISSLNSLLVPWAMPHESSNRIFAKAFATLPTLYPSLLVRRSKLGLL